ncbi:MAG: type II toxin-antitoxin system HicB family antitoxin [Gammaproteobacteria bacterium]
MSIMKYKGYIAQIDYSEEDEEFFGFVVNISQDQISFGGTTVKQLKKHMEEAIEGHIRNCKMLGLEPEKPYSGRITFRTTPEEHALFVEAAFRSGNRSLNEWMEEVLMHEAERKLNEARQN